jgi:AhpD family alkylhydroperoxidase
LHAQAPVKPKAAAAAPAAAAPAKGAKGAAPAAAPSPAAAARADIKATLGFVPTFLNDVPDVALPGAWEEMKGLQMNPNTAVPGKYKELIGLAVSAQVPCKYCIIAHTEFAKLNGATDAEIREAVMMAALTRHWSTWFAGQQVDLKTFRGIVGQWVAYIKKGGAGPNAKPIHVVDAATAQQEAMQAFGVLPEFMKRFPAEGFAGAWKEMRDVEMNPKTAIPGKYKSLIGLAVASQTPCPYCVVADTEFAKLEGASEREIGEAIGMAAITRHWSTYLNGSQTDETTFNRDIEKLVRNVKQQQVAANRAQAKAAKEAAAAQAKAKRDQERAAKDAAAAQAKAAKEAAAAQAKAAKDAAAAQAKAAKEAAAAQAKAAKEAAQAEKKAAAQPATPAAQPAAPAATAAKPAAPAATATKPAAPAAAKPAAPATKPAASPAASAAAKPAPAAAK